MPKNRKIPDKIFKDFINAVGHPGMKSLMKATYLTEEEFFRYTLSLYAFMTTHRYMIETLVEPGSTRRNNQSESINLAYYFKDQNFRSRNLHQKIFKALAEIHELYVELANESFEYELAYTLEELRKLFKNKKVSFDEFTNVLRDIFSQRNPDITLEEWLGKNELKRQAFEKIISSHNSKRLEDKKDLRYEILKKLLPDVPISRRTVEEKNSKIRKILGRLKQKSETKPTLLSARKVTKKNLWLFNPKAPDYAKSFEILLGDFLMFQRVRPEDQERVKTAFSEAIKNVSKPEQEKFIKDLSTSTHDRLDVKKYKLYGENIIKRAKIL